MNAKKANATATTALEIPRSFRHSARSYLLLVGRRSEREPNCPVSFFSRVSSKQPAHTHVPARQKWFFTFLRVFWTSLSNPMENPTECSLEFGADFLI